MTHPPHDGSELGGRRARRRAQENGEGPWEGFEPRSGDPLDEPLGDRTRTDAGPDEQSPPNDFGARAGGSLPPHRPVPDLSGLMVLLDVVRAAVPREMQEGFTAMVREVLLALRALIDRYLLRLDGREERPRVEDIPIE
jgi:hypothetical protein